MVSMVNVAQDLSVSRRAVRFLIVLRGASAPVMPTAKPPRHLKTLVPPAWPRVGHADPAGGFRHHPRHGLAGRPATHRPPCVNATLSGARVSPSTIRQPTEQPGADPRRVAA